MAIPAHPHRSRPRASRAPRASLGFHHLHRYHRKRAPFCEDAIKECGVRDMTTRSLSTAEDFNLSLSTLQDEVRDLKLKMTQLVEYNGENARLRSKQTDVNYKIYTTQFTLENRLAALEQHAPAIARFEAHEASYNTLSVSQATIAQLLSRVAALERPWHRRFTRASDPPGSTPPATNMTTTALLRRMDEFNS
jgi:hypothetical protein